LRAEKQFLVKGFVMVRREWKSEGSDFQCCRGDEGRPLEAGVQKLASNQAVPLWSKRHGGEQLLKNRSEEAGR
jgi:hypothetical protein